MNIKIVIKLFLAVSILFVGTNAFSQIAPDTYVIKFKDKNNSAYSLLKPEEFLSKDAIDRRTKYNITLTEEDLPVNDAYLAKLKDLGLEIYAVSKWLNLAVVHTTDSTLYEKALALDFVDPQYTIMQEPKDKQSENPTYKRLKKVKATKGGDFKYDYGKGENQASMLKVDVLHSLGFRGEGMTIAVLDAGFYKVDKLPAFDSIQAKKQILGVRDMVQRDGEVYADDSHGMMVLSCIAGNIPGELVGTAPEAHFYLIRTEDARSETIVEEYYWVQGVEYADSLGVDMIHSSLGYAKFDEDLYSHTYAEMNGDVAPISIGADIASTKGILVVTSAGNEGNDPWHYVSAPADADLVLSVGSVTGIGGVSNFSSRGPSVDGRIKPDAMAQGSLAKVSGRSGRIEGSFGTSFSGPILAGAVACLWQANPDFTNQEIIEAVRRTASRALSPDADYGYGIPNLALADAYLKSLKKK